MNRTATIVNSGLILDRKLNQVRQFNSNGVRLSINNQTFTLGLATPLSVSFGTTSVVYYNMVLNNIEVGTTNVLGNNATHFEICRWNDNGKKWVGNENGITAILADADVRWNLNKLLYITPNVNKHIVIDLFSNTIKIPTQLSYQFSDSLNVGTTSTEVIIDINFIAIGKTIYLYLDATNGVFIAVAHDVKPINGARDLYFITSFRKDVAKSAKVSYNQHAIKVAIDGTEQLGKVFALGDSLTALSNWVTEFIKLHPQTFEINNAGDSGSKVTNVFPNAMVNRIDTMPSDTNLLIFFGGTNDYDQPLGIIQPLGSVFDDTTFIGAYQKTIEKAYLINPKISILIIVTSPRFNGVNIDNIVTSVREIAELYNLPIVDLHKNMQLNLINQTQYLTDGLHYNNLGGAKVARMILDGVNKNF